MSEGKYQSTKTYGHERGFSVCFRQWRAESHCRWLHGYALSFRFVFETEVLDSNGWVVDFGGLKELERLLKHNYDHRLIVAEDDPLLDLFIMLQPTGVSMRIVPATGCEAFAREAWGLAAHIIERDYVFVRVISCEVAEHGSNSAIYFGGNDE